MIISEMNKVVEVPGRICSGLLNVLKRRLELWVDEVTQSYFNGFNSGWVLVMPMIDQVSSKFRSKIPTTNEQKMNLPSY